MLKSSSLCLYSSNLGNFWLKIEQFWPFGNQNKGARLKILGILHAFRIFFNRKGSFYLNLEKARNISDLLYCRRFDRYRGCQED
jgi:hypothetical protein